METINYLSQSRKKKPYTLETDMRERWVRRENNFFHDHVSYLI